MVNQVTKKDVMDAIEYLHVMGMVNKMTSDKKHYTEILIKAVANIYNINLELDKNQ